MMDIQAASSPGPRFQDRAEPGKTPSDSGFASLLGALGGKTSEAVEPTERRRRDDDREDTPAAVEAPAPQTQPTDTAPREAQASDTAAANEAGGTAAGEPAGTGDGTGDGKAGATGGKTAEGGVPATAAAQQAAAGQAPAAAATTTSAAPAADPVAAAGGTPAATTAASGTPAPLAAAQQTAAPAQAAAGTFRIAGQDGPLRGEVRLEAAAQAPRAALSGNTALAASLAASTDGGGQSAAGDLASGQGLGTAAPQGQAKIADGTAAKTFAGLAAEAADQPSAQDASAVGKTPVLQAAGGDDIQLPAGLDAARVATAPTQAASAAASATPAAPNQGPVADQVATQMHRALSIGKDRLSIQLHPAELGRVDIKLELAQDGSVRAVLHAERKDTMDLLQRDARGLERALQNAGLQTDGNSISFDLRGGQQQRSGQGFASPFPSGERGANAGLADGSDTQAPPARAEARHDGAVNIRV